MRSHSAGLPVSVRTQRVAPPLPVSITGQRSLQPHHVHPEHPPPPQRPPMTASAYQRSIYRGDSGRMGPGPPSQAQQPQPDTASASQAANLQLPEQSSAEEQACSEGVPSLQEDAPLPGTPDGSPDAAQASTVASAARHSASAAPPIVPEAGTSGDGSTQASGQPDMAEGSSKSEPKQHALQQSPSGAPAATAPPLDMPPLPPPAVHQVHMGRAELDGLLKVDLTPSGTKALNLSQYFLSCPDRLQGQPTVSQVVQDVQIQCFMS